MAYPFDSYWRQFLQGPQYTDITRSLRTAMAVPNYSNVISDSIRARTDLENLFPRDYGRSLVVDIVPSHIRDAMRLPLIDLLPAWDLPALQVFSPPEVIRTPDLIAPATIRFIEDIVRSPHFRLGPDWSMPPAVDVSAVQQALADTVLSIPTHDIMAAYTESFSGANVSALAGFAAQRRQFLSQVVGLDTRGILANITLGGVTIDLPRPQQLADLSDLLASPQFAPGGLFDRLIDELLRDEQTAEDVDAAANEVATTWSLSGEQARQLVIGLLAVCIMYGYVHFSQPSSLGESTTDFLMWMFGGIGVSTEGSRRVVKGYDWLQGRRSAPPTGDSDIAT
ncbi:hypothetical protein WSS_A29179 [Rhodococcus opacus M213]|uniref:Uncharacterized protein n=1 Tax=Rhodococcus opacus M213 TaxID=1129896 RepID=K8XCD1_RHOOP|nr:hypothetical protein [Rhodococcus opacus]EKT79044.1 hypothetical protein WSS_A29179 [Rhodococcus opacus M213]